jgi:hypothetical protein
MTENRNANTSKTIDDSHKAAESGHVDAKGTTHDMHNKADIKSHDVSGHEKTGMHKDVSADPKFKDHNMHKDADVKTQSVSEPEKTGIHKSVSADAKADTHTMHKDAGMKTHDESGHEKTGTHKDMSADPKSRDHTMHKDADVKTHDNSGHEKTGAHKDVSTDPKVSAHNKKEIHAQISGALAGAKFPVKTPADLISAFPKGAATTCHSGDVTMTVGDAGKLLKAADFPFTSAKAIADLIVERASI